MKLLRVGVFARYVQWWEKGPGDLNVFTAVIEMMALESKLYRKRSESGRENSVFQKVEGKITLWPKFCLVFSSYVSPVVLFFFF